MYKTIVDRYRELCTLVYYTILVPHYNSISIEADRLTVRLAQFSKSTQYGTCATP